MHLKTLPPAGWNLRARLIHLHPLKKTCSLGSVALNEAKHAVTGGVCSPVLFTYARLCVHILDFSLALLTTAFHNHVGFELGCAEFLSLSAESGLRVGESRVASV